MKEIRWELILMPLVSIVLGIYLIMQPGAATVALCSLIGWLILLAGAAGAVNSVTFQRATFMTSPLLPVSVAGIMVGLFFITRPYTLVEIVGLIICVFLMIQGMTSIQTAVNRKRWGDTLWWVPLVIGIACVLLGVYALFAPGASTALMMRSAAPPYASRSIRVTEFSCMVSTRMVILRNRSACSFICSCFQPSAP